MKKNKKKEILFAYSWSAPSLILILLIVIFPILYTGYISLTNMNVYHWNNYELIGLKNYKDALLVLDNGFIQAFLVTILWTIVNMVLQLIIAFLLANLLNLRRLRLKPTRRTTPNGNRRSLSYQVKEKPNMNRINICSCSVSLSLDTINSADSHLA